MKLLDLSPLSPGPVDAPRQPGLSSLSNGIWVHGLAALENCRVDPQSTVLDVWENLSLDPVSPSAGMRHRADLAVGQLKALQLDQKAEWCVAVPMSWTKPVVQIFLGVAQECGLSIAGCFPRTLLLADAHFDESGLVMEWGWKDLYASRMHVEQGSWRIAGIERVPEGGVIPSFRREAKLAAEWMLEHHRVDLLHSGSTEQELFAAWWKWHNDEAADWVGGIGSVQSNLSDQCDGLQEVHHSLFEKHDIGNDVAAVGPAPLVHLSGYGKWKTESSPCLPELDRLQLQEGKGPRWRDSLRVGGHISEEKSRVTHVVVKGIAEPAPDDLDAEPGDQVRLKDGRDGMAIYVPEG